MRSLMKCSTARNLLQIEQVQGMVSLPLILLLLVLLFLFLLLIMLKLRAMRLKLNQLVRTQTRVNLSQEHLLSLRRKMLPRAKKANFQKPKQKKQHICHHCGAASHSRPNCYKWLATQQSNDMIASGSQNKLQSFLAPVGDLLKAFIFLSNLNCFNSSPSPPV